MMNIAHRLIAGFTFSILFASAATAQTTTAQGAFSLQGKLTSGMSNETVADGQYNIMVTVYEEGTQTVVMTETDLVTVTDGVFSTMVGDNASLMLETDTDYELGVSIDGGAEMSPRIMLGSAPHAITAEVAADAEMLGGMMVSSTGGANTILSTNAQGRLDAELLNNSFNITGSGVSVSTEGGRLNLEISGGTGSFELPYTGSSNVGTGESAFSLTAMGEGSAATFLNNGTGSALTLSSNNAGTASLDIMNNGGAAIRAVGSMSGGAILDLQNTSTNPNAAIISAANAQGDAAFEVMANGRTVINSTSGNALDITTEAGADAALRLHNTSAEAGARLISAMGTGGNAMFEVMANGRTVINSTAGDALEVSTSAAGEAALKVTGGLMLDGPAGRATLPSGMNSVTIDNDLVNENSVILITVNSATSLANGLRLSGQGDGTFTVSLLDTALGTLNGGVEFNYLIINTATE